MPGHSGSTAYKALILVIFMSLLAVWAYGCSSRRQVTPRHPAASAGGVLAPPTPDQLQRLVAERSDRISFRVFQYLRSRSPFPPPYAYLFVLLVMTAGVKLCALPLQVRAARNAIRMQAVAPLIQDIQRQHAGDQQAINLETLRVWQEHGIDLWAGCLVLPLDLIFVVWGLIALVGYSPQLVLDGSRFAWVADVTKFSFSIMLLWVTFTTVQTIVQISTQKTGQDLAMFVWSSIVSSGLITLAAWHWGWPAYIFIFWTLLALVGAVITSILKPIVKAIS